MVWIEKEAMRMRRSDNAIHDVCGLNCEKGGAWKDVAYDILYDILAWVGILAIW